PSLFEWQVGAHNVPFEACSGFTRIAARRLADPPMVGPCSESFSDSVALLAVSVATGMYRHNFPGRTFTCKRHGPFRGAHSNPCLSRDYVFVGVVARYDLLGRERVDATKTCS